MAKCRLYSALSTNFLFICLIALSLIPVSAVSAKPLQSKPATTISELSNKTLERNIEQVESDESLSKEVQSQLLSLYRKAISNLETAAARKEAATAYIQARQNAPAETAALHSETVKARKMSPIESLKVTNKTSIDELQQLQLKEQADLAAAVANLQKIREQIQYQNDRPQVIREELIEAKNQASGLADELKPKATEDRSQPLEQASYWLRESRAHMLLAQINMLNEELLSQPARLDLLDARLEKAKHSVDFVKARTRLLETLLNKKRQSQAKQTESKAAIAKAHSAGTHPLVEKLAANNAELSSQISALTRNMKTLEQERAVITAESDRIDKDYTSAKQKLEVAGLSQILGQVLQEQRRSLPDTRGYKARASDLEQQIAEISLQQIQHKDELEALRSIDSYIDNYTKILSKDDKQKIKKKLVVLAQDRSQFLEQLNQTEEAYLRALSDLDFAQRSLSNVAEQYDNFLSERLLWIRSTNPVSLTTLAVLPRQIQEFMALENWRDILTTLYQQATKKPWIILTILVFIILLLRQPVQRRKLVATSQHIGNVINDNIGYTAWGLVLTLILAASWPLLMAGIGWQLFTAIDSSAITKNVGHGLILTSEGLFLLRAYRVLCMKGGVADQHFKWPAASLALLRHDIDIFTYTFLPAGFVALVVINSNIPGHDEGLGRIAFVFASLALAAFLYRVLNPARGAMHEITIHQKKPAKIGIQYFRLVIALVIPIGSAVLALLGYLYSAATLLENLIQTLWLILGLVILHQFVVRWLLIARRRLALQQARAERNARLAARKDSGQETGEDTLEFEEPRINIEALSDDIRKLLNTTLLIFAAVVLWAAWVDILPALHILDSITLWQHQVDVEGELKYMPVTLADVSMAIITIIVLIALVKRLPAFLEILLRQRSAITTGSLYAIKSLTSYTIIAAGVVMVFGQLGGTWSGIQWIFAALGVGIGFGLQEIVANFISGLIILFERPIRVGDRVTVGEVNGIVTKIRIRATTIRDFDRKELLVPNKEFITNRLLNWSLSDTVTRISIPVGIAYGSDVTRATQLLEEAASENEYVIDEPPTSIIFDSFGDNSLVLILRYFIENQDYRLVSKSQLNEAINEKFNKAGISIAFPQRDVHLDTARPLDVVIHRESS